MSILLADQALEMSLLGGPASHQAIHSQTAKIRMGSQGGHKHPKKQDFSLILRVALSDALCLNRALVLQFGDGKLNALWQVVFRKGDGEAIFGMEG